MPDNSQLIADMVAHQLRSSLSAANWYLEMLLDEQGGQLTAEQRDYMDELKSAHQRMMELVDQLLSMSKIELGTLQVASEAVDLKKIIDRLKGLFGPQLKDKKLELGLDLPKGPLVVQSDAKLLFIVLENLLSNAIKYTPTEGRVSLKVEAGDKTKVTVSDTGLGIPKDEQTQIFSRFYRATNAKSKGSDGNGLGLYITKNLVEKMGGSIRFESEENKGTSFFLEL